MSETTSNKLKVLNIWGGPCTGKSTTAAGLFADMKLAGMSVELVTEYAKDMTWERRFNILGDQTYILAKQNRRLSRLQGEVEYAVTDSPLPLSLVYYEGEIPAAFELHVWDMFSAYDNLNFLLPRNPHFYDTAGRNQGMTEALEIDRKILNTLSSAGLCCMRLADGGNFRDQIALKAGFMSEDYIRKSSQRTYYNLSGLVSDNDR